MILDKLLSHNYVGGRHTHIDNIPKGFAPHEHKEVMEAFKELQKEGFFIIRPKLDGRHVSMNQRMLHKVREVLES
jgi:hypothetical protein